MCHLNISQKVAIAHVLIVGSYAADANSSYATATSDLGIFQVLAECQSYSPLQSEVKQMNIETKNTCYTHNVSFDAIATVHMYSYPHL